VYVDQDITADDSDESAARSGVYAFGGILYQMAMIGGSPQEDHTQQAASGERAGDLGVPEHLH
jgi:hypothetical protein